MSANDSSFPSRITFAEGDGIGPEIMEATLKILDAADVGIEFDEVKIGKQVYEQGVSSGIPQEAWDTLRKNSIFLKAPITTPQGKGYKSLNVTLRKTLGLYANVRPCFSYAPFVNSRFPKVNMVIIRENEEDTYAGIEHRQTDEVYQCLKLISRPGCERIVHYAFDYARRHGRKHVTCLSKDNIMKMTDGIFHQVFNEVAQQYPDISTDHRIIDIGTALIADDPERFDVVVTLNLYGDIISDVAAQICGSVGLAGSVNIGKNFGMFEAIHGSAPDIAGKGIANPSALLNASVFMLNHIGKADAAECIQNAWRKTIEDGVHTGDIYREGLSSRLVGTQDFAKAVIERLGEEPGTLPKVSYKTANHAPFDLPEPTKHKGTKELVGVDVFLHWDEDDRNPDTLGEQLEKITPEGWTLKMISNRGVKVYPDGFPETFCTDHWRCRFRLTENSSGEGYSEVLPLLTTLSNGGMDIVKTENLYLFDGQPAYSLGQGE
jgi:isocitrate dehydrogenase